MLGSQIGEGELSNPVITQTVAREPGLPGTYHLRACWCQELEPSKGQGPLGQPAAQLPRQPALPGALLRDDPSPWHPLPGRETPTMLSLSKSPGGGCLGPCAPARETLPGICALKLRGLRGLIRHWNKLLPGAQAGWSSARTSEQQEFPPFLLCARLLPRAAEGEVGGLFPSPSWYLPHHPAEPLKT